MSQPVLLKIYGNIAPVDARLGAELAAVAKSAWPPENAHAEMNGDMLLVSFEGVYFPLEEALEAISKYLTKNSAGKLDALDIENWRLVRHLFKDGSINVKTAPLNNVLDYSGH